jgi:hypothetical protein
MTRDTAELLTAAALAIGLLALALALPRVLASMAVALGGIIACAGVVA